MSVQFVPPSSERLPELSQAIKMAVAALPPDAKGALVGVATTAGVNAAIVIRNDQGWAVEAWIGKSWKGPVSAGASILKTW